MGSQLFCVLHVATSGKQGLELGSDQKEIVLLNYVIINANERTVIANMQCVVKPDQFSNEGESLSEEMLQKSSLTNDIVNHGIPLKAAISQFHDFIINLQRTHTGNKKLYLRLVVDGKLPLRQCLLPEAKSKNISLPSYYYWFYDLVKEYKRVFKRQEEVKTVRDIVELLQLQINRDSSLYMTDIQYMVDITQQMLARGYKFERMEKIRLQQVPQAYLADANVEYDCVVRVSGFSYFLTEKTVLAFFQGLTVRKGGVALSLNSHRQINGGAYVVFANRKQCNMALKRNEHHFGNRIISVERASKEEFIHAAGEINTEAKAFLAKRARMILGMQGIPYDCTVQQVLNFFEKKAPRTRVMDGPEGVLFVRKRDGSATGYAFVLFLQECQAEKAFKKNLKRIDSHTVTLYFATHNNVKTVLSRALATNIPTHQASVIDDILPPPYVDQNLLVSGMKNDCIRLSGLPSITKVRHVHKFLGSFTKKLTPQGIHIVYQSPGLPRGDAFIRMNSEESAYLTAQDRNGKSMKIGDKKWILQVNQCSGEDMRLALATERPTEPEAPPNASAAQFPHENMCPAHPHTIKYFVPTYNLGSACCNHQHEYAVFQLPMHPAAAQVNPPAVFDTSMLPPSSFNPQLPMNPGAAQINPPALFDTSMPPPAYLAPQLPMHPATAQVNPPPIFDSSMPPPASL